MSVARVGRAKPPAAARSARAARPRSVPASFGIARGERLELLAPAAARRAPWPWPPTSTAAAWPPGRRAEHPPRRQARAPRRRTRDERSLDPASCLSCPTPRTAGLRRPVRAARGRCPRQDRNAETAARIAVITAAPCRTGLDDRVLHDAQRLVDPRRTSTPAADRRARPARRASDVTRAASSDDPMRLLDERPDLAADLVGGRRQLLRDAQQRQRSGRSGSRPSRRGRRPSPPRQNDCQSFTRSPCGPARTTRGRARRRP